MSSLKSTAQIDVGLVGERLLQLRELRGDSLGTVATKAGIAKSYLAKLERGEVDNPGVGTLGQVASALETSLVELFAPPTGSHKRARWSSVVDPLEVERIRATLPEALSRVLEELGSESGRVPADVVRTLASVQLHGRRPRTADDWRFAYLALSRCVS
jgi:transcriptional regulator with XRE-family HTH domain